MGNMSYCRFENTLNDLVDCKEALDSEGAEEIIEGANEYEKPKVKQLIKLCIEIADSYEYVLDDEDDED